MTIRKMLGAFLGKMTGEHHRYCSWEHCYRYFHETTPKGIVADRDRAALHLGFYLASWGMYRGSSFLLQNTFTIHRNVIDQIVRPQFTDLWKQEFGSGDNDSNLRPDILQITGAVGEAYLPHKASDTLKTKVVLGTLGCLPACDRFFIDGFRSMGRGYSSVNENFMDQLLSFCRDNLGTLREEQGKIQRIRGIRYPLMKLVDMYFWQIGYNRANGNARVKQNAE